jgi:hypothetical protein
LIRIRTDPTTGSHTPTTTEPWAPSPPTSADLARQVRDVVVHLPRFLTAPLLRRALLRVSGHVRG